MDSYLFRHGSSPASSKPLPRPRWKRTIAEVTGKLPSKYRHEISTLLLESYSKIGDFGHFYYINGVSCLTLLNRVVDRDTGNTRAPVIRREGISGLEFDTKGIYLASVTKPGCLTVHDFESLYCVSNGVSPSLCGEETKHLLHLRIHQQCDVVRWNRTNQDEVACASMQSSKILFFDIGYISFDPVRVLNKKPNQDMQGYQGHGGLSDIAFASNDNSRVLASSLDGALYVWDWRLGNLPCLDVKTSQRCPINSIQLGAEEQIVFGASEHGTIYAWDLRGGRASIAFLNHNEVYHSPLTSVKVASMLEKITPLKAQSKISSRGIHSINFDPSCPYQLAFHLDDGWSGVLNTNSSQVTHIHCPPPAWLNGGDTSNTLFVRRKPSWLPASSSQRVGQLQSCRKIYAVPSSFEDGIHLLDFYPDSSSACHVDFHEESQIISKETKQAMSNRFVPLSAGIITACAVHPLNSTIIAGTQDSSLLMVSQMHHSYDGEE